MYGHDHTAQAFRRQGIFYLDCGPSGAYPDPQSWCGGCSEWHGPTDKVVGGEYLLDMWATQVAMDVEILDKLIKYSFRSLVNGNILK